VSQFVERPVMIVQFPRYISEDYVSIPGFDPVAEESRGGVRCHGPRQYGMFDVEKANIELAFHCN